MSAAVLEREQEEEVLYQPTLQEIGVGGQHICDDQRCSKPAVWEFTFHPDSAFPCHVKRWRKAHTDFAIMSVLSSLEDGPMHCYTCWDLYESANEYMKVVRIP